MKPYKPELSQMHFGCPWSEYECPEFIEALLRHLQSEIERVEWNLRQEEYHAPGDNYGEVYATEAFEMRDYWWGEDCTCGTPEGAEHKADCGPYRPNFQCGDFEVRWYKHLGRGMSMSRPIDANEFGEMIDRCLASVRIKEARDGPQPPQA